MPSQPPRRSILAIIGPGMIVAATGVGAGDLATGAFTGSKLGVAILWAVVLGAVLKFTVNEGLARWQLATGRTLLEGVAEHLGRWAMVLFLAYLVFWSYFVAAALMSACGVALNALVPVFSDAARGKIVFGILQSALTVALIHGGGFRWFERIMSGLVGVMFVVVVGTAVAIGPDWPQVFVGMFVPRIPHAEGEGVSWTLALLGGIGGTVTVLSYGYWIREEGRKGTGEIRTCRLDLAAGYTMTALFGLGMVIIGSEFLNLKGDPAKGTRFIIDLGKQIEERSPRSGRWPAGDSSLGPGRLFIRACSESGKVCRFCSPTRGDSSGNPLAMRATLWQIPSRGRTFCINWRWRRFRRLACGSTSSKCRSSTPSSGRCSFLRWPSCC